MPAIVRKWSNEGEQHHNEADDDGWRQKNQKVRRRVRIQALVFLLKKKKRCSRLKLTLRRRQVAQAIFLLRIGPLDSFLALAPPFKDLTLAASSTSSFLLSAERQSLWVGLSMPGRTGEEVLVLIGVNMIMKLLVLCGKMLN